MNNISQHRQELIRLRGELKSLNEQYKTAAITQREFERSGIELQRHVSNVSKQLNENIKRMKGQKY